MPRKQYMHAEDDRGLEAHMILIQKRQWQWITSQKGGASKFFRSLVAFAMGEMHELQLLRKRIKELEYQLELLTEGVNLKKAARKRGRPLKGHVPGQPNIVIIDTPPSINDKKVPK